MDFQSGLDRIDEETKSQYRAKWSGGKDRLDEIPGLFGKMDPMPGAIEAVHKLAEEYDVFILSTAPWKNPSAWSDKVEWVTKYFDDVFHKRIIITHRKDLVEGDYLIDDRGKNGTSEFKGEWIQFGSEKFPDWDAVLNYLIVPLRKYPLKLHIRYLTNPHESSSMRWPYSEPTKYAGEQIYTVMLTEREQETVRMMMFGAQRTSSARKISERIKGEIKGVLDNSLGMDCDPNWIECEWASGEKERLTAELRYLNLQDVILMKSRVAEKGENIIVRNPYSIRPYQHVLEPLSIYLTIAKMQYEDTKLAGYYNVGPDDVDCVETGKLADIFCNAWGDGISWENKYDGGPHEATFLKLNCDRIKEVFGWSPVWNIEKAVEMVCQFEKRRIAEPDKVRDEMSLEINSFLKI